MVKKIVLATLLVGLIGIMLAGGIIRTMDKTETVAEAGGQGYGRGRGQQSELLATTGPGLYGESQAEGQGSTGRGRGYGQGNGNSQSSQDVERLYRNVEALPQEWTVVVGTLLETPEAGVDLVVETDSGEQVTVGTGPGYMEAQGFTVQAGEQVQVQGYWEGDELKATQVTRLQDGLSITLGDESGRPAWSGGGRRAAEQQALAIQGGRQGQGGGGQGGAGRGGYGSEGNESAPGGGTGTGQAQVDAWVTLQGTVSAVDGNALIVQTSDGQEVVVENRAWWFAQEQGFSAQAGDRVTLVGFYEAEDLSTGSRQSFEVGRIDNASSGQTVLIREENGRPLWAGGGRRGG